MRISQKNENPPRQKNRQSPKTPRAQATDNRLSFPKRARIRTRGHYQKLISQGKKILGEMVGADLRSGHSSCAKLGITVAKRHGKAHDRNLFKRLVREAFRLSYPRFPQDLEINVFPRLPIEKVTQAGIMADLFRFVEKIKK